MKRTLGRTKRTHELAVRTTISMPPVLWDAGSSKQRQNGYSSFSDYVQELIRKDALVITVTVTKAP